jgi:uncharacterized protein YegP (UPF0339 family)
MPRKSKFELYRDRKKEWRWRLVSSNGNIVADSSEGYRRRDTASASIGRFIKSVQTARIVVVEPKSEVS